MATRRERIESTFVVDGTVQRDDLYAYLVLVHEKLDVQVAHARKAVLWLALAAAAFVLISLGLVTNSSFGPFSFASRVPLLVVILLAAHYFYLEVVAKISQSNDTSDMFASLFRVWSPQGYSADMEIHLHPDVPLYFPWGNTATEGNTSALGRLVDRVATVFMMILTLAPTAFFLYAYWALFRDIRFWVLAFVPLTVAAVAFFVLVLFAHRDDGTEVSTTSEG